MRSRAGAAAPEAPPARPGSGSWIDRLKGVALEYPYGAVHGVLVADGRVVSCEGVQESLPFFPSPPPPSEGHWDALAAFCEKLGWGRLAEIRFCRGRPVSARVSGRKSRRLLRER